ncbi:hypothetical protein [Thermococcus sp. JCM 11816]|uniref:hypothetical protein n=1 Tax=Thermococcus sp. (strain JCM 11816 / KS-1) TaxID=1295125 RepID=UPI0034672CC0
MKNSEGIKLLIEEVAKAVGVSPKELIEYYEWKANREKLKKMKPTRMTKKEAKKLHTLPEGKEEDKRGRGH